MRITQDMTIAGAPAVKLRDALKRIGGASWSAANLASQLGVDESTGDSVAALLLEEGFIEVICQDTGRNMFTATVKGGALALASAAKPIKRETAERLVQGVIRAAQAVNADDRYYLRVRKVLAFGSYLTDAKTLGDVDLVVEVDARVEAGMQNMRAIMEYAERAQAGGRRLPSMADKMYWPVEEVHRVLKGASKAISIHNNLDGILETTATRVIYEPSV